jgi:hypothetical protein
MFILVRELVIIITRRFLGTIDGMISCQPANHLVTFPPKLLLSMGGLQVPNNKWGEAPQHTRQGPSTHCPQAGAAALHTHNTH